MTFIDETFSKLKADGKQISPKTTSILKKKVFLVIAIVCTTILIGAVAVIIAFAIGKYFILFHSKNFTLKLTKMFLQTG